MSKILGKNITFNTTTGLQLFDADASNFIALKAPAVVGTNVTLILPDDDGTPGQILSTNGSGVLDWIDAGSVDLTAITSNVLPATNDLYHFGSPSFRWSGGYFTPNDSDDGKAISILNQALSKEFYINTDSSGAFGPVDFQISTGGGGTSLGLSSNAALFFECGGNMFFRNAAGHMELTSVGHLFLKDQDGLGSRLNLGGDGTVELSAADSFLLQDADGGQSTLTMNGAGGTQWTGGSGSFVQLNAGGNIVLNSQDNINLISVVNISLSAGSGIIDANNGTITNLAGPINPSDATTKDYVDDFITIAGYWQKFTLPFGNFATAGLTNDIEVYSLPALGVIQNVVIHHTAAFTGGTISAYTLSVGISGNFTKYANAFDVFQAPGDTVFQYSNSENMESFGGATSIRVQATSVGDNLDQAATGSVDIYIKIGQLEAL